MENPPEESNHVLQWRPRPSGAGRIAVAMATLSGVCSAAAWIYVVGRPIALDSFIAVVAGAGCAVLAIAAAILGYGYYSMRYRLDDREVAVVWLRRRETIPLSCIEAVYRGQRLGKRARVEGGVAWPGHYVGTAEAEDLGRLKFYGTTPEPSHALILATAGGAYALTPEDLPGFRDRLFQRLEALPEEEIQQASQPRTDAPRLLRISLLGDRVAMGLLAVALLALLGSFGYLSARFPDFPDLIPLHRGLAGEPDLIGPAGDIFRMPLLGALLLGANSLMATAIHRWQRDASRILAAATIMLELVMLIAVVRLVH